MWRFSDRGLFRFFLSSEDHERALSFGQAHGLILAQLFNLWGNCHTSNSATRLQPDFIIDQIDQLNQNERRMGGTRL